MQFFIQFAFQKIIGQVAQLPETLFESKGRKFESAQFFFAYFYLVSLIAFQRWDTINVLPVYFFGTKY